MLLLCFGAGIACCYDYKRGRIPNALLAAMFFVGWGYAAWSCGVQGMIRFPTESLLVMLILYPLFRIGAMGAGDIKLYGICAGYLTHDKFLIFFFISLLIAAVFSLFKMIKEQNGMDRVNYLCEYLLAVVQSGRFRLYFENEREHKRACICLAGPILCSILLGLGGIY